MNRILASHVYPNIDLYITQYNFGHLHHAYLICHFFRVFFRVLNMISIPGGHFKCTQCDYTDVGVNWQCMNCENCRLCMSCYHGDKHSLQHLFVRHDSDDGNG